MPPEEPPCRVSRGSSHIPPEWVSSDATFFITINCRPRGTNHLTAGDMPARIFETITFLKDRKKWYPEMVLLMPDHLHALISFPWEKGTGMNQVLADWKRYVSNRLGVSWQRDFFDHRIRSLEDHQSTWFYIRENPVRAGLVESYEQWPHVWLPDRTGWGAPDNRQRQGPTSGRSCE